MYSIAARLALPKLRGFHVLEEGLRDRCVVRHKYCAATEECVFHIAQRNSTRVLDQRRDMDLDQRSPREHREAL